MESDADKIEQAGSDRLERRVIRYFWVRFEEAYNPKSLASAAIRSCMCCNTVLSGMGGGGDYMCEDCIDKMEKGDMAIALTLLAKENEKNKV